MKLNFRVYVQFIFLNCIILFYFINILNYLILFKSLAKKNMALAKTYFF